MSQPPQNVIDLAIETAERAIQTDPNRTRVWTGLYNQLAWCKMKLGDAEAAR